MAVGESGDAHEREHRRLLDAGTGSDGDRRGDPAPVGGHEEADDDERDHDGVVVHATDEVHEHERVERAEPDGLVARDAHLLGQPRQGVGDDADCDERRQTHGDGGEQRIPAGQVDDEPLDLQGDGAVGRRGEQPQRVHLVGKRAGYGDRAGLIRVHAAADDEPLGRVAVRVAAEQRRNGDDGQAPPGPRRDRGRGHALGGAQVQPRVEQAQQPDHDDCGSGEPSGLGEHVGEERRVVQGRVGGDERRGERTQRDEQHREETLPHVRPTPCGREVLTSTVGQGSHIAKRRRRSSATLCARTDVFRRAHVPPSEVP